MRDHNTGLLALRPPQNQGPQLDADRYRADNKAKCRESKNTSSKTNGLQNEESAITRLPMGITTYFRGCPAVEDYPSRRRLVPPPANQIKKKRGRRHLSPSRKKKSGSTSRDVPRGVVIEEANDKGGEGHVVAPWNRTTNMEKRFLRKAKTNDQTHYSRASSSGSPIHNDHRRWNGLALQEASRGIDHGSTTGSKHAEKRRRDKGRGERVGGRRHFDEQRLRQGDHRIELAWKEENDDGSPIKQPLTARTSYLVPYNSHAILPHPKFGGGRKAVSHLQTRVGSLLRGGEEGRGLTRVSEPRY